MSRLKTPEIERLRELYEEEGLSLRQIAERYGVSYQAVHNRLVRAGVAFRHSKQISAALDKKVLSKLYQKEHLTKAEIARRLGVSFGVVTSELERLGIPKLTALDRAAKRISRERLIKLYEIDGLRQWEIYKRLKLDKQVLLDLLRHYKITFRHRVKK